MITAAAQDYLKSIYKLQNGLEPVQSVNTSMIAEKMHVAAASATNMVKKLADMDLVQHTPYKGVGLTPAGEAAALEVIRHHRLLELYLAKELGYEWDEVDAEAEQLEHVISEAFEDRIDQALGHPKVDPHGAPIPSKGGVLTGEGCAPLANLEPGTVAVVSRVSDRDPEMLREMDGLGLRPGARVEVVETGGSGRRPQIRVEGGALLTLAPELAGRVFVHLDHGR